MDVMPAAEDFPIELSPKPIFAVSEKILVAPAAARKDARLVKTVPMSAQRAICATEFAEEWVVMATVGNGAALNGRCSDVPVAM